jgi:hypothetical protein
MSINSTAALLWPVLVVLGGLPLLFLILDRKGYSKWTRGMGAIAGITTLILIYRIESVRLILQWVLTVVAFAAPLALSVISIEYLVEET